MDKHTDPPHNVTDEFQQLDDCEPMAEPLEAVVKCEGGPFDGFATSCRPDWNAIRAFHLRLQKQEPDGYEYIYDYAHDYEDKAEGQLTVATIVVVYKGRVRLKGTEKPKRGPRAQKPRRRKG